MCLRVRTRTEVVVDHVYPVITVSVVTVLIALTAIDAVGLSPVEDHVIDKLIVHKLVVVAPVF